jgi:hypothetical protein
LRLKKGLADPASDLVILEQVEPKLSADDQLRDDVEAFTAFLTYICIADDMHFKGSTK